MKKILFKAIQIETNKWVEGYVYFSKGITKTYAFITPIIDDCSRQIIPETICQYININCQNDNKTKIFENDIVEVTIHSGKKYRYLIWFNQEISELTALPFEDLRFNGNDYWSINSSFGEFSVMLQDHYGHIKNVKVIGNVFDNPELLEFAKENM